MTIGLQPTRHHQEYERELALLDTPAGAPQPAAPAAPAPPVPAARAHVRGGTHRDLSLPGLSILILCKDELRSLNAALQTWDKGGVLDYADEVLLYFQGRTARKEKFVESYIKSGKVRLRLLVCGLDASGCSAMRPAVSRVPAPPYNNPDHTHPG